MKIYCPKCEWEPTVDATWVCGMTGCGHVWNTFDTMGKCPNCAKIWQNTQCLHCQHWSKHMEWYHIDRASDEELKEFEELQLSNEAFDDL